MVRFGVIGHPIAHSLSPLMHSTAYSLLGLDCSYEAFEIAPQDVKNAIGDFASRGFRGLNVTIPHKETVRAMIDDLSEEARAVGAVNTILFDNGRMRGENTDVYGFAASLQPHQSSVDGQRVLLLGAGGSARAILFALLTRFRPAEIVVANRHQERAAELIRQFAAFAGGTTLQSADTREPQLTQMAIAARLILNATPAGMSPDVESSPLDDRVAFRSDHLVFDTVYTPLTTRLLASALRSGARTLSGLEMFLHQGARSFQLWLGQPMPVDKIRPVIQAELKQRIINHR